MVTTAMKLKDTYSLKKEMETHSMVKLHGLNRVEGYSPWGRKESDMTELLHFHLTPWKESYDQTKQHIKKQRYYFSNKGLSSQSYGFSNSHVWMWELDHKESWLPKNWCFWAVVLEKTLESPLDCKETQLVHPKCDQSWVFIGRTNEAATPVLWPPHAKS